MFKYFFITLSLICTQLQAECIISNTPNNKFCLERLTLEDNHKLKFYFNDIESKDFSYKKTTKNWVTITFKNSEFKSQKGEIKALDEKGKIIKTIPLELINKNHFEGVDKLNNMIKTINF